MANQFSALSAALAKPGYKAVPVELSDEDRKIAQRAQTQKMKAEGYRPIGLARNVAGMEEAMRRNGFNGTFEQGLNAAFPGSQIVDHPEYGKVIKLGPSGVAHPEIFGNYQDDDWLTKAMPMIIAGIATAGMTGLLPGTTSAFGGAAGAAGAGVNGLAEGAILSGEGVGAGGIADAAMFAGTAAGTSSLGNLLPPLSTVPEVSGMLPDIAGMSGIGSVAGALGALGAGAAGAGAAGSAATGAGALSKLLGLTGTAGTAIDALGRFLPGLAGAYASNQQSNDYKDLANQYAGYGAPYRQKLSDLYANPSSFLTSPEVTTPVQQGTDIMAHSLSMNGNPAGSGNSLQQLQSYATDQLYGKLGQEKDRLAGFGGLSNYNAAAPSAQTNAIGSAGNTYNAIGSGLSNVFNPPQTAAQQMADFYKMINQNGQGA